MKYRLPAPYYAPPFATEQRSEGGVRTLSLDGYRQARSYSCGFASALMVLRYFGSEVCAAGLFDELGTGRDGTRQNSLVRVLRSKGVSASVRYDMDFDRLGRAIDRGKPIIAYLADAEHWLVLYGYGYGPRRVFAADPRPGHRCEYDWESYGERLGSFGIVCSQRRASRSDAPEPAVIVADEPRATGETRPAPAQLTLPLCG